MKTSVQFEVERSVMLKGKVTYTLKKKGGTQAHNVDISETNFHVNTAVLD